MKWKKLVTGNILCHGPHQLAGTSNGYMRKSCERQMEEVRVLKTYLAITRLLKVDYDEKCFNINSSPSKTLSPQTLTPLKCNCKEEHCNCSHLNGCNHPFMFHPDLKKGIPDQSGIRKTTKQNECPISF